MNVYVVRGNCDLKELAGKPAIEQVEEALRLQFQPVTEDSAPVVASIASAIRNEPPLRLFLFEGDAFLIPEGAPAGRMIERLRRLTECCF